jgi:hypothetical protein
MRVGVNANEEVRQGFGAETFSVDLVSIGFYDRA